MFKIDIKGVEPVVAKFERAKNCGSVVRPCILKSLADMKARSNGLTPCDTGQLRNSAYGNITGDTSGVFGFSAFYAPFVEYGHRIVFHGRELGFQPPNPFLEPNARAQESIFASDLERAISRLTSG